MNKLRAPVYWVNDGREQSRGESSQIYRAWANAQQCAYPPSVLTSGFGGRYPLASAPVPGIRCVLSAFDGSDSDEFRCHICHG